MQEANQNNLFNMDDCELSILEDTQAPFLFTRSVRFLFSAFEDIEKHEEREQLSHFHQCSHFLDWSLKDLCWDIDIEQAVELQTSEAQYAYEPDNFEMILWSSMLSGSKKRKRDLVSDILSEAEMLKVCKRKLNKGKMEDMVFTTSLVCNLMGMKASHLLTKDFGSIKQIEMQCLVRSNLQYINPHVLGMEGKCKEASLEADEAKWFSLELTEFNKSYLQCLELFFVVPLMRTDVCGRLPYLEELPLGVINLETPLYDKAKYRMEYKIFQGLEQALESTAWGKTPDYLESIANRIEQARGKATEVFHIPVQVLVCAAIKEMEDLPVENLDWDTLEKWGATLKYAEEFGFRVGFADNLLKTNLLAFLAYSTMVG